MKRFTQSLLALSLLVLTACSTTGKVYMNDDCTKTFEVLEKQRAPLGDGISERDLTVILGLNSENFSACRRKHLGVRSEDEGNVALRIMIGADGKVIESCAIGSQFENKVFNQCVADGIKTLVFKKPKDGLPFALTYREEFHIDHF